jgi:PAS domain S-box-containing protein
MNKLDRKYSSLKAGVTFVIGSLIAVASFALIVSWSSLAGIKHQAASIRQVDSGSIARRAIRRELIDDVGRIEVIDRAIASWRAAYRHEPEIQAILGALDARMRRWQSLRQEQRHAAKASAELKAIFGDMDRLAAAEDAALRHDSEAITHLSAAMSRFNLVFMVILLLITAALPWLLGRMRAEDERFRQIAGAIDEVFWMTSPSGDRTLYISPGYEKIWGRTCAGLYASPAEWIDAIIPEDRERVHAAFQNAAAGYEAEYRIDTPAGIRWIRDKGSLIRDASGAVVSIAGVAADITDSKKADADLRASEERFRTLVEAAPDAFYLADADGRIIDANSVAWERLGYTREELFGMTVPDFAMEVDKETFKRLLVKNLAGERVTRGGTHRRKDGTTFPIEASMNLAYRDGKQCALAVVRDVSARIELERKVRQSEKLAAVGQLAAGVAHEINNPLGVILGFAQGMAGELKTGDSLELPIKSIEREALRCKALVQSLLTFSRASKSDRAAVDVNRAVEDALVLFQPHAKISRVVVSTALASDLPSILGDKSQIEQVILNLAKNAADAMPDGGALRLSTQLNHSWITLKVVDSGTGIPSDVVSKIFDPFFTTKPVGQGTGLGLSLVSEIVKKHGGEISVESRPGRTEFTVKVPIAA